MFHLYQHIVLKETYYNVPTFRIYHWQIQGSKRRAFSLHILCGFYSYMYIETWFSYLYHTKYVRVYFDFTTNNTDKRISFFWKYCVVCLAVAWHHVHAGKGENFLKKPLLYCVGAFFEWWLLFEAYNFNYWKKNRVNNVQGILNELKSKKWCTLDVRTYFQCRC